MYDESVSYKVSKFYNVLKHLKLNDFFLNNSFKLVQL